MTATLLTFGRFAIVGAGNTVTSFAVYSLLLHIDVPYLVAAVLAFLAGATLGYSLNRRWTFRARASMRSRRVYLAVQCLALGESLLLLWMLVDTLGVPPLASQAIAVATVAVTSFALNRKWTFADARGCDQSRALRPQPP